MTDPRLAGSWRRLKVVDLCSVHVDCVNRTAAVVEGPTPYKMIRTTNVRNGFIDTENVRYVAEETYRRWTRRLVPQRGDVVLTREAPLGDVGIVRSDDHIFLGQRLYHFRADPEQLDPRFLAYALMAPDLQAQIKSFGSGSTVEHMRLEDIPLLEIDAPPLPVQRNLAGVLATCDDFIENNLRRIQIIEELARAIYREWFVRFRFPGHEEVGRVESPLGPIPEGWSIRTLGEVCYLTMGQSPPSEFYNEVGDGLPFHQGVTDFGARFPSDRLFCTREGRLAERGDILFSVRAPVGRMNIARRRLVLGRGLSAIRHREGHQAFLWELLRDRFQEEDTMGNGAIFASVTKGELAGQRVLSPATPVVERASAHLAPLHRLAEVLSLRVENLRAMRDLLLPRLMSGQLSLSEAEEAVPASL